MYNVMIVDDEPIIKQGLLCFVNWEALDCHVVCEAGNGIDAMEKLSCTTVDIVITDIKCREWEAWSCQNLFMKLIPT